MSIWLLVVGRTSHVLLILAFPAFHLIQSLHRIRNARCGKTYASLGELPDSKSTSAALFSQVIKGKITMKSTHSFLSRFAHPSASFIIGALLIYMPATIAADESDSFRERWIQKTQRLEDRMSEKFRDTWRDLRESIDGRIHSEHLLSSASVDVREQNDNYTIRVSLPDRDINKLEISMVQGNQLRIYAPADGKAGAYEQIIGLDNVAATTKPNITRKPEEDLAIVQLAKTSGDRAPGSVAETVPLTPLPSPTDRWDREIIESMQRMRREMDQMFKESFKDFGDIPELKGMFDKSRLGSSVEIREEDGNYIIRAYLPERDAKNIKVTVDNDRILKIEAEERSEQEKNGTVMERESHYLQHLTLPGPVDAEKLKVDRTNGMLIITVPMK